ncbi:MAG: 1-deoxy-D-xylulose-5-phosphate reductoisomerase [Chthoniobacterales bacterium]
MIFASPGSLENVALPRLRRVSILGATGSVGQSALRVARSLPDRIQLVGLTAHLNGEALAAAQRDFPEAKAVRTDDDDGPDRLIEMATLPEANVVLIAIVGTAGLRPALAAIEAGKDIAVASKEILVLAGSILTEAAHRRGVRILPVDSEHNAIFQCLEGRSSEHISRLILTCSGGPFRDTPANQFAGVTPAMALKHPTWNMGRKISLDSATLFNKALEMIEARWLFGVALDRIDVVIHPQSIVHSLVEFVDGSQLAQLSHSDMAFPIQYALTYPDRVPGAMKQLDLSAIGRLEFSAPRLTDFPALRLAREAGTTGGTLPAVLNAANEIAAHAFLESRIRFPQIWETVERTMVAHTVETNPDLEALLTADQWAREEATRWVSKSIR